MLLASNLLVATFVLFLFFSFAEISQGSGNQPRNGVGDPLMMFSERKFVKKRAAQPTSFSPTTDDDLLPSAHGASTTLSPVTAGQGRTPMDQGNVEPGTRMGGPKIVGGTDAQPGSWPWQVLLNFKAHLRPVWCGGSILNRYWIVTAAHCFDCGNNPEFFTVTVGEHDLNTGEGTEQIILIDKIIVHPEYDPQEEPNYDYDVALIKLRDAINFTSNVRPVLLVTIDFPPGTSCYVTGWGNTKEKGNISLILQQVEVPLISRETCRGSHGKYLITERMRCAGFFRGGVDSCRGDSGGPLVCPSNDKWYLVGIVSWEVGCARRNTFGVYADVLALNPWVQETIASAPAP